MSRWVESEFETEDYGVWQSLMATAHEQGFHVEVYATLDHLEAGPMSPEADFLTLHEARALPGQRLTFYTLTRPLHDAALLWLRMNAPAQEAP